MVLAGAEAEAQASKVAVQQAQAELEEADRHRDQVVKSIAGEEGPRARLPRRHSWWSTSASWTPTTPATRRAWITGLPRWPKQCRPGRMLWWLILTLMWQCAWAEPVKMEAAAQEVPQRAAQQLQAPPRQERQQQRPR